VTCHLQEEIEKEKEKKKSGGTRWAISIREAVRL
jgi:hypothetical protein